MSDPGYEFLEHTADVKMRAWGDSLAELFTHAAEGLRELTVQQSRITPSEGRSVMLRSGSVQDLFRDWLKELIVWFDAERFIPASYSLTSVSETTLVGSVMGERFDPARHAAGTEVKAVTLHEFHVGQDAGGRWEARVIFDV